MIDNKIREICKEKEFTSFWECFDYIKLANYEELDALMISLDLFDGKIWDAVVSAKSQCVQKITTSNGTIINGRADMFDLADVLPSVTRSGNEPDDLLIEVSIMTKKAKKNYKPIYKAYLETKIYKQIPDLEEHIKTIKTYLTTELAISIFNDGDDKF